MTTTDVTDWSEYDAMRAELETRARDLTASFHRLLNDLRGMDIKHGKRVAFYKKLDNIAYNAMRRGRIKNRERNEIHVRLHGIGFWSGEKIGWVNLDISLPELYLEGHISYKRAYAILQALQQYVMEAKLLE